VSRRDFLVWPAASTAALAFLSTQAAERDQLVLIADGGRIPLQHVAGRSVRRAEP
jgi:hypothetical protein